METNKKNNLWQHNMPVLVLVIFILVRIVDLLRHLDSFLWSGEHSYFCRGWRSWLYKILIYSWGSLFTKLFLPWKKQILINITFQNPWKQNFRFRRFLKIANVSDFHFSIALSNELALALAGQPGQELLEDGHRLPHRGHLVSFHSPLHLDGNCTSNMKARVLLLPQTPPQLSRKHQSLPQVVKQWEPGEDIQQPR